MDSQTYYVVIFISCILLSSFFSAAETALTSLSEAKTRQLIDSGRRSTKGLQLWLKWPNRVLATLLVGNNLLNTMSAAIATVLAQHYLGDYAISFATGIVTLILLIFCEITPKTFAKHNAIWVAPVAMNLLLPLYWVLYPLVSSLSWIASNIVKIFGVKAYTSGPIATEEDIAFLIRLGHREGVLAHEEGEMLESVIELRDTLVREAMVPRTNIYSFDINSTHEDVVAEVREHSHTRWPVYDENMDNIKGILHTKDLLGVMPEDLRDFHLSKIMRPALFVPETMKVGDLLREFRRGRAHLAIVVDEYGGTAGIISLEDILEEIVGEIRDEYDSLEDETVIKKIDDTHFVADARASIHELNAIVGTKIPEEDNYESLGGFLIATFGKMPVISTQITYGDCKYTIKEGDEKKIVRVLVEKLPRVQIPGDKHHE